MRITTPSEVAKQAGNKYLGVLVAAKFARYRMQSKTALDPTDDRYAFAVADWNGDGRLDLVTVQKSGTTSGRTEARILAG